MAFDEREPRSEKEGGFRNRELFSTVEIPKLADIVHARSLRHSSSGTPKKSRKFIWNRNSHKEPLNKDELHQNRVMAGLALITVPPFFIVAYATGATAEASALGFIMVGGFAVVATALTIGIAFWLLTRKHKN